MFVNSYDTKKEIEILDELFLHFIDFSRKHIAEESIKSEVSHEQFKVLFHLYGKEKVNMNEIGDNVCISNSASTVLIDKLIKLELVERSRSEKDRRLVEVSVTEKGKDLLKKIIDRRHKLIEGFLNTMNKDERSIISQSINILDKNLKSFDIKRK